MATKLESDKFALELPPTDLTDIQDANRYLESIHDYLAALREDIKTLRDKVDA